MHQAHPSFWNVLGIALLRLRIIFMRFISCILLLSLSDPVDRGIWDYFVGLVDFGTLTFFVGLFGSWIFKICSVVGSWRPRYYFLCQHGILEITDLDFFFCARILGILILILLSCGILWIRTVAHPGESRVKFGILRQKWIREVCFCKNILNLKIWPS